MAVVISPLILSWIVFLVSALVIQTAFGSYLQGLSLFIPENEIPEAPVPDNVFVPYEEPPATGDDPVLPPDEIDGNEIRFPKRGEYYANLTFVRLGVDVELRFDDNETALRRGNAGQNYGTEPVGYGTPMLICGHNNGKFNNLQHLIVGDEIRITTSYGIYVYQVTAMELHQDTDPNAFDLYQDKDQLILYTCYPFTALGLTHTRYFVYADKVSGPYIVH